MAFARVPVPALLLSIALLPGAAFAQTPTATATPAATPAPAAPAATPPAANAPTGTAPVATPADGTAPAAADAPPAKPKVEATGYGYADPKPRRATGAPRAHRVAARAAGPIATLPGFEMTADGGSRLFVQLTQNVPVEEKKAAGSVTYVLKGAHVAKHNNQNALVTVHFNTPVSRARLVPSGHDLLFIVDMRSSVTPAWKVEPAKDNSAVLAIDFPKGDFLPSGPVAPLSTDPSADPNANTTTDRTTRTKPAAAARVKKK